LFLAFVQIFHSIGLEDGKDANQTGSEDTLTKGKEKVVTEEKKRELAHTKNCRGEGQMLQTPALAGSAGKRRREEITGEMLQGLEAPLLISAGILLA